MAEYSKSENVLELNPALYININSKESRRVLQCVLRGKVMNWNDPQQNIYWGPIAQECG
ncbi:unnamed protein product, partial [Rotaria magnacalcarata]